MPQDHPEATSNRPSARWPVPHLVHLAARRRACPFHKLRLFSSTLPRRAPESAHGPAGTSPPRGFLAQTPGELSGPSHWAVCAVLGGLHLSKASCARTFSENSSPTAAAGRAGLPVAVRTMEANAMRLCRRLRPTARFSCLLRLRSLENEEFTSKTALSHLCCSRRAPSSIFKLADRTLKSSVRRVCRRLCLAAPFTRLLRLLTLENDEFTFETGHMWPL